MLRKNKSSRSAKRRKVYIAVACISFLLLIFKGAINHGVELVSYVVFPIQKKIYEIGDYIKRTKEAIVSYQEILEENQVLKNEQIKYDILLSYNEKILEENKRLQEILKIKEEKNLNLRVTKVNFRNPSNLYTRFYINLGKKDGVKKNMIVLSGETLIGKVGRVYENYSIVDMITSENFNVSALTESQMLGIVKGSDEEDGTLYFEANTFQNNIEIGEKIYTSGISEIYPKGLYIGKVSEIDEDNGELFRSIKVKNDIDILSMMEVLILMPEDKKEVKNGKN
ncbi:rod shape-determining protein MreC [Fusobacterium mortiferum]|uniref:rod shape-determining protein MreC n=1 Tax=Fusobacterium mortiferum TaxID=850 RepID=UPI00195CBB54|nr:rod shape-determining protein MreC [uncultured Fusobacterium sp.]MBM6821688.1 rod shape-determining protein MreC [Fusobacterium mortiferum]